MVGADRAPSGESERETIEAVTDRNLLDEVDGVEDIEPVGRDDCR